MVEAVDLAKLYVFPEWVVHSAFTVFLSVRLMAELSVTTFWTFLRELSPLWSHCRWPPRIPADFNGSLGVRRLSIRGSSRRFPVASLGHGRKFAADNLTRRARGLQFRLAGSSSQASQSCFRFASARAWRASCRAASSSSGMLSPVLKYISSGVCPRNAECGSRELCSCT